MQNKELIDRLLKVTLIFLSLHIIVIEGMRHKHILFSENTF